MNFSLVPHVGTGIHTFLRKSTIAVVSEYVRVVKTLLFGTYGILFSNLVSIALMTS